MGKHFLKGAWYIQKREGKPTFILLNISPKGPHSTVLICQGLGCPYLLFSGTQWRQYRLAPEESIWSLDSKSCMNQRKELWIDWEYVFDPDGPVVLGEDSGAPNNSTSHFCSILRRLQFFNSLLLYSYVKLFVIILTFHMEFLLCTGDIQVQLVKVLSWLS